MLEKDGHKYVNSDLVRYKLLRSSPRFLGPLVDIQADIINQTLGDFAESMRHNTNVGLRHIEGPETTLYARLTAHPHLQEVFYRNMGDASKKAFAQVLDLYLTLASGEGMTYSPSDMEKAVRDAGFSCVERHDNLGFSHSLVVGHK